MASRGLSLTTRIFGSTAVVVAAVLGVTLFFTSREAERTADTTVSRALAQAKDQIATQLDARRRALQGQAEIFAQEPNFRSLVQSKAKLGDLLDQVIEAHERIGADWVQATDAAGILLAKSDDPGAGQLVVGTLMAVRAIDTTFAQSVKSASPDSIDVAFFALDSAGPRVVTSTIGTDSDIRRAIAGMPWPTARDPAADSAPVAVRTTAQVGGVRYVTLGAPLRAASGSLVGGMVVFRNRDREFAAFRRLEQTIIVWGVLGLAFTGILAFGIARQITRPVLALVSATKRAADGDYSADITVMAGGEIGTLADAFRAMLGDLRDKQALVDFLSTSNAEAMTVQFAAVSATTGMRKFHGSGITPGTTFANRYEVKELLGVGGMGMVFKAVDSELGEVIAIKTLKQEMLGNDTGALERFKSEIRLARRISHRNVVRTHDFGEYGGVYFITMEYVEGQSLKDLIHSRGKLPMPVTLSVGKQLCRALGVAHDQGVIHRDVKPQNMVVQADGVLKVMDFGIARLAKRPSGVTQRGMMVGTPEYMAPEQLVGDEIDVRADIYAAGCVLYECLTGNTPITADTPITLIAKVLEETPVAPRVLNGEVPGALSDLVIACLSKNAANRPQTALELHDRLAAIG